MLYRIPESQSSSDNDQADSVDSEESVAHPPTSASESEESDTEGSVGEPSPDDQEGAGEEDRVPVVVLRQLSVTTSCCSCGRSATVAVLGHPDALSILEQLLYTDRLNPLCSTCAASLDPLNRYDGRQ